MPTRTPAPRGADIALLAPRLAAIAGMGAAKPRSLGGGFPIPRGGRFARLRAAVLTA